MNFVLLIIIFVVVIVASYLIKNKIVFRFDTLFRKGFKKINDKYGVFAFCRQTTETGKHTAALI